MKFLDGQPVHWLYLRIESEKEVLAVIILKAYQRKHFGRHRFNQRSGYVSNFFLHNFLCKTFQNCFVLYCDRVSRT